jgi:hypothetical protein
MTRRPRDRSRSVLSAERDCSGVSCPQSMMTFQPSRKYYNERREIGAAMDERRPVNRQVPPTLTERPNRRTAMDEVNRQVDTPEFRQPNSGIP